MPQQSLFTRIRERTFAPVDIASIVFFRIAFGLVMVADVVMMRNQIAAYWMQPRFLFKYYGFSWVHPWPGNGLYIHWTAFGILAAFIAAGFLYRISAVLFFLSCSYFFLLDESQYVNHTYLMCLFGFLLIFPPPMDSLCCELRRIAARFAGRSAPFLAAYSFGDVLCGRFFPHSQ